jgi:hypothetical protein
MPLHHTRPNTMVAVGSSIWGLKPKPYLRPWLKPDLAACIFSPREVMESISSDRRENRVSPMTPSQAARRRRTRPQKTPGDPYTTCSYGRAIATACRKAFPSPAELVTAPQGEAEHQKADRLAKLRHRQLC